MSILIDKLLSDKKDYQTTNNGELNGGWFIAKPLSPSLFCKEIIRRLKDAYRIITGRSFAVHYREDEN